MTRPALPGSSLGYRASVRLATLLAVTAATACGFSQGPRLIFPGEDAFGVGLEAVPLHRPYAFGSVPLCLDGKGIVRLETVTFAEGGDGLKVRRFAIREHIPGKGDMLGADPGRLDQHGFAQASHRFDIPCPPKGKAPKRFGELGLELGRAAPRTVRGKNIVVAYRSGARRAR